MFETAPLVIESIVINSVQKIIGLNRPNIFGSALGYVCVCLS